MLAEEKLRGFAERISDDLPEDLAVLRELPMAALEAGVTFDSLEGGWMVSMMLQVEVRPEQMTRLIWNPITAYRWLRMLLSRHSKLVSPSSIDSSYWPAFDCWQGSPDYSMWAMHFGNVVSASTPANEMNGGGRREPSL